jgi:hypothetical protein
MDLHSCGYRLLVASRSVSLVGFVLPIILAFANPAAPGRIIIRTQFQRPSPSLRAPARPLAPAVTARLARIINPPFGRARCPVR